jgi:putative ABC transport system permease protein
LRVDWRQEWEAELRSRETLLAEWDKLDRRNKLDLLRRSAGAFWDALLLQPRRLEDEMFQDLRIGARMLLKQPSFTLIAALTLALGIGANTTVFSVVNAVLLRPLNYKDPEQLVWVWGPLPKFNAANHSGAEFDAIQTQQTVFSDIAAYHNTAFTVTGEGQPQQVGGLLTSANYFSLLGVAAARGRAFQQEDGRPGAARVAVASYDFWQKRFGGDPSLLGKTLRINGESVSVVGIMPPSLPPLAPGQSPELWVNLRQGALEVEMNFHGDVDRFDEHYLRVLARLKPGVSAPQAQAKLDAIMARLAEQYPSQKGHGARVVSLPELFVGDLRQTLLLLLGAVGLVLLIACANVTNLLLARGARRYREFAIRAAVGASRFALLRQLLVESVLLAGVGGLAGWLLAAWGMKLILAMIPRTILPSPEIGLDSRVFLFTLAVSLTTGVIFGLIPAFLAAKSDLASALKEGARGASTGTGPARLRKTLVVAEVALAMVVLIGAGLLVKSFARLTAVKPGFDPNNLLTLWVSLTGAAYGSDAANLRFIKELTPRLEALPGVQGVAISNSFPIQGTNSTTIPEIEGHSLALDQRPLVGHHAVSPHYFEAMGIRLLKGRVFTERDNADAPRAVIINEALARRVWPNEEALGKRLRFGSSESWSEVVGVVANVKHDGLLMADRPHCYSPHLQLPMPFLAVAIRSQLDQTALVSSLRRAVQQIDPDMPIAAVQTMQEKMKGALATRRLTLALFNLFAVIALLLAAIGLYGVMSYGVAQRTQESGIRMALGAQTRDVLRLFVIQGMKPALVGMGIGLAAAFGLTRLMSSLLFGVSVTDPLTFALIALLLIVVALLACYFPAHRATKVDPLVALRRE